MARDADCPECGETLELPKGFDRSKKVRCPDCDTKFFPFPQGGKAAGSPKWLPFAIGGGLVALLGIAAVVALAIFAFTGSKKDAPEVAKAPNPARRTADETRPTSRPELTPPTQPEPPQPELPPAPQPAPQSNSNPTPRVRDLNNAIQRAVVLGESPLIEVADLPQTFWNAEAMRDPDALEEGVLRGESAHRTAIEADARQSRSDQALAHWAEFALPQDRTAWGGCELRVELWLRGSQFADKIDYRLPSRIRMALSRRF